MGGPLKNECQEATINSPPMEIELHRDIISTVLDLLAQEDIRHILRMARVSKAFYRLIEEATDRYLGLHGNMINGPSFECGQGHKSTRPHLNFTWWEQARIVYSFHAHLDKFIFHQGRFYENVNNPSVSTLCISDREYVREIGVCSRELLLRNMAPGIIDINDFIWGLYTCRQVKVDVKHLDGVDLWWIRALNRGLDSVVVWVQSMHKELNMVPLEGFGYTFQA